MSTVAQIETHRAALQATPARPDAELTLAPPASAGERAQWLYREAQAVSLEQVKALQVSLAATQELAREIAGAGELFGPGLHAFATRFAEELFWRAKTLDGLAERRRAAVLG